MDNKKLHNNTFLEKKLNLDDSYVIVDKEDWIKARKKLEIFEISEESRVAIKKESNLKNEIKNLLNNCSRENESNTPDFILAEYLIGCLNNFETAIGSRDGWHGDIK